MKHEILSDINAKNLKRYGNLFARLSSSWTRGLS